MLEIEGEHPDKLVHRATTEAIIGAVEIKINPQYDKRDEAQLLNELKDTGLKVGLLLNFGRTQVEYKHPCSSVAEK
jgi:GxxExxY protein